MDYLREQSSELRVVLNFMRLRVVQVVIIHLNLMIHQTIHIILMHMNQMKTKMIMKMKKTILVQNHQMKMMKKRKKIDFHLGRTIRQEHRESI